MVEIAAAAAAPSTCRRVGSSTPSLVGCGCWWSASLDADTATAMRPDAGVRARRCERADAGAARSTGAPPVMARADGCMWISG